MPHRFGSLASAPVLILVCLAAIPLRKRPDAHHQALGLEVSSKHQGSINEFYKYVTAPHLKSSEEINIHIRKLTREYSNLSGYGVPLAANFIKDLQLARELNLDQRDIWPTKTAAFCSKPDLHLVNFVSFLSGRLTFEDFSKLDRENYNATNLSKYCLAHYWQE